MLIAGLGGNHGQIPTCPRDPSSQPRVLQPLHLLGAAARFVVDAIDRSDHVGRISRYDDIAEHEAAARSEDGRYPPEEIRLAHAVQVVKREHRDDQIERPIRQRVLKPLDEQVHATSRQHAPSTSQHLATCVDADQVRSRIRFEHASRTLAGARA